MFNLMDKGRLLDTFHKSPFPDAFLDVVLMK